MAKPPKKILRTSTPETSATSTDPLANPQGIPRGEPGQPDPGALPGHLLSDTSSPHALPQAPSNRPSVIVSHAPGPELAPDVPGTSVRTGQPSTLNEPSVLAGPSRSEQPSPPVFVHAELASQLKRQPSTEEGFRYDKRKKAYVEMHGGFVMVSNTPDGWRHTEAGEATPSGRRVEQIPGTRLWREIDTSRRSPQSVPEPVAAGPSEAIPGPSRHSHLDEQSHIASDTNTLVENLFAQQTTALDLSTSQWRNWGKATRPDAGESIEIDGKHYPIIAQNLRADTGLVYLQNPAYSSDGFDAFENMLRQQPSHQPKWALKREGQWKVLDNHAPFEMSATQYVSTAFNHLSEQSASNLARAVFDRVSLPQGITGHGLSVMALTYRHWIDRVSNEAPMHGLSDPLVMLPVLATPPGSLANGGLMTLPAYNSNLLQRLDFDPVRFPREWTLYSAAPTAGRLRTLFMDVLQHSGYTVNPTTRRLREGAVIFHRPGVAAVFVLKLPPVTGDQVPRYTRAGSDLHDPEFQASLTPEQRQRLNSELTHIEVIYLVGGVQHIHPDNPSLFIVREG